ncbi:hypothetical protein NDU88_000104 [Pleurodeles waltl]|uniref:Uncharacterized protein n=1 Tax=Pleurodeles waltl TaxID=8319 RepID=A0AAV7VSH7_PLEWA|nr:hypothetical protein NDU88_000104 [Pleurodeles waltl]
MSHTSPKTAGQKSLEQMKYNQKQKEIIQELKIGSKKKEENLIRCKKLQRFRSMAPNADNYKTELPQAIWARGNKNSGVASKIRRSYRQAW